MSVSEREDEGGTSSDCDVILVVEGIIGTEIHISETGHVYTSFHSE